MKFRNFLTVTLVLILAVSACKKNVTDTNKPAITDTTKIIVVKPDTVPKATYNLSLLISNKSFDPVPSVIDLVNQELHEISGIAPSLTYGGKFYIHEDSGNSNEVYIIDLNGANLGKLILDGSTNIDWEDITTGPGPVAGKNYVYVADIGDNKASRSAVVIYRFIEPEISVFTAISALHIPVDKIILNYPAGSVNAESFLVDPLTKDIYLATKQSGTSTIYKATYPQVINTAITLKPVAKLPFDLLTSGSISADGSEVLLRNTGQIWYWKRESNESIAHLLLRSPQDAPYFRNERQGEAIGFSGDGKGYVTISEIKGYADAKNAISFYKRN
ncbi:myo-inositol-hexaphosphate 3-phosphohydrolase [Pedobacter sp. UYP24]